MDKFRIVKHEYCASFGITLRRWCNFEVQKRFLGFLWWYNFENIDAIQTGFYDSEFEAIQAIERHRTSHTKEVVRTFQ